MSKKLAINGGPKIRNEPFPKHPIIEGEEKNAAMEVLNSGNLSTFLAVPGNYFQGGKKIKEFEKVVADYHKMEYAVAFNSATAALHAAVVACGVQFGEEVITTPYTFTSTATCALMNNSIPVFADVRPDTFNIDPKSIEKLISPLSSAIIPVHIFGQPADMDEIIAIAKENNLRVIEDCAQAPGATYKNKLVGTMGDCGVLSFTETKHVTSGEGGMLITNDEEIAEVARLIRNHGEAIIEGQARSYKSTILGWNYRMTEIDAAIGCEQFKKLDRFLKERRRLADYLSEKIRQVDGLTPPYVMPGNTHSYFIYAIKYDAGKVGIPRNRLVEALNAEGIPCGAGYVRPLYYAPIYHENKPFIYRHYQGNASYEPGLCPVAERLYGKELITTIITRPPTTAKDMDDVYLAVKKIIENKEELQL